MGSTAPTSVDFSAGMTVRARGERFVVLEVDPLPHASDGSAQTRLLLRGLEGPLRGRELPVIVPIEPVEPEQTRPLDLSRPGRLARFRLLHDAFSLQLAPPPDLLVGASRSHVVFEPYQQVPALRALSLPRARLLIADDVGLGKTIEAGLVLRDLNARRRSSRVLIVCPPSIVKQWHDEMAQKFGFRFRVFADRNDVLTAKRALEAGDNPWKAEPRIITSRDFIKRKEGAFLELSAAHWDVVIIDEAHHVAARPDEEDKLQHDLAVWLAEATDSLLLLTATPHDGYDENFASLLRLLDPTLAPTGQPLVYQQYSRHLIRRLKRHIRLPDDTPKFVEREVRGIPYPLTEDELALHRAVLRRAGEMEEAAEAARRAEEREAIRLVATVLRKRAASSREALRCTLGTRRENLGERAETIELQREYVRAFKRGETLPEEVQAQLERDAHRSYRSIMYGLAGKLRHIRTEEEALENLEDLLAACDAAPESKLTAMMGWLSEVHAGSPDAKIIIFSEYVDTVDAVFAHLEASGYAGQVVRLAGESLMTRAEREESLKQFGGPTVKILVATDVASEGMNLQEHCHHMLHVDLPWNPNRLEQRNGRIDRYGQGRKPIIRFLYAKDTYDGELLAMLAGKLEKEITRIGSVGDVLGHVQLEALERLMLEAPEDELTAVRAAEEQVDHALNVGYEPSAAIGTGESDEAETGRAQRAAERGRTEFTPIDRFVELAVRLAHGQVERRNGRLTVVTPQAWIGGPVEPRYEGLRAPGIDDAESVTPETLLHEEHPLVQAAVRWVRASRFHPDDDHRLAFAISSAVPAPDLIATFTVTVRDGEGTEMQRLEPVRVDRSSAVSRSRDADLEAFGVKDEGEIDLDELAELYRPWWEAAREAAAAEAARRAGEWARTLATQRRTEDPDLRDELRQWDDASKAAILGPHQKQHAQPVLFQQAEKLPNRVLRQLRRHEERVRQRRNFLDRRLQIAEPVVEPLGVLLRVPLAREVR
jgi:superfamily II DNA or RNA helicase